MPCPSRAPAEASPGDDATDVEAPADPVRLPLDGVLDLHTFDPRELGDLLPAWLDESHAAGLRELRVIHGKGTGALRRSVEAILGRHPRVLAFRPAGEAAGGWGATVVTLRG